jgi:signal transduction histidine kinase
MFTGRTATIGFAVILALLCVNGYLAYRAVTTLIANERIVSHTHAVIISLDEALGSMKDAETGERGFVITGQDNYLEPYRPAVLRIDSQMATITTLISDNPAQQARLRRLRPIADRLMARLRHIIDLRRNYGRDSASNVMSTNKGKLLMDSIRVAFAEMKATEESLLNERSAESRANGGDALLTLVVASGLGLTLVVLVYYLLNRDIRHRREREEALRISHDELDKRVRERTNELTVANESLVTEIAERRRAEAQLQQFTVELERSNRELQDFAFVASHDLQEPLRKIQAFGDRLKKKYAESWEPEALDYMERMQNAAGRMHVLINDLLTFSRVSSKAQPFLPVSLANVADGVLSDLEVRIQGSGGTVDVGPLAMIEADSLQMRQLFQNLIANSLKFHRPGVPPHVRVSGTIVTASAENEPGAYELTVEDNGIGFDEKYLDKIFTPFQRLHNRTEYEGTGMGLAVCRKIVERHGGSITARSIPGTGTTFVVRLPISHRTSRPK